jgi:hypothetical protein
VCAIRATIECPSGTAWDEFARLCWAAEQSAEVTSAIDAGLDRLLGLVGGAVDRPALAGLVEAYTVFRITGLEREGSPVGPEAVTDDHLVALLVNEKRPLSQAARTDLLAHRLSYYADELSLLTWDNAVIIDPRADDHDIEYVLEFANAQLLELRYFDEVIDRELPNIQEQAAIVRRRRIHVSTRSFTPLLSRLQTRVVDISETVERVDNSLKVTDDVHLARVYTRALAIFGEGAWRRGIDRKLAIMRETYAMLNDAAQAARSEILEMAIVLLIVVEIILGLTVLA